jgi:ribosome maturation factor RimP
MEKNEILEKVERVTRPVLDQLGYRLIEREYTHEHGQWILRLYIDKEGGVTVGDCESASRALEDLLDVELDIGHRYSLEVSSPGINRPLRYREDFEKYRGALIKLKTRYPLDGRSNYKGVIEEIAGDDIFMVVDGMRFKIPFEALAKARLEEEILEGN